MYIIYKTLTSITETIEIIFLSIGVTLISTCFNLKYKSQCNDNKKKCIFLLIKSHLQHKNRNIQIK